jgi:hypothetical protein
MKCLQARAWMLRRPNAIPWISCCESHRSPASPPDPRPRVLLRVDRAIVSFYYRWVVGAAAVLIRWIGRRDESPSRGSTWEAFR